MMMHATLTPLRFARLRAQVPQYLLAKRARLCASRLSALERGYDDANARERAALAKALGLPELELFPLPTSEAAVALANPDAHMAVPPATPSATAP